MRMTLAPVMRMVLCMVCQVCKRPMIENEDDTVQSFEAALKGIGGRYNQCKCGRIVLSPLCNDTNYRRRWRYWNGKVNFYKG